MSCGEHQRFAVHLEKWASLNPWTTHIRSHTFVVNDPVLEALIIRIIRMFVCVGVQIQNLRGRFDKVISVLNPVATHTHV